MSKELEVIKRDLDYEKCLEIVKKQPNCCLAPRVNAIDKIEEDLKALEIIKPYLEKIIGMNQYDRDFYECFLHIRDSSILITKEEYDILKRCCYEIN